MSFDERAVVWMRTHGHTPTLDRVLVRFSAVGEHGVMWLAMGAAGWVLDPRRRGDWSRGVATVAGVYGLNTAIKLVVGRPRPNPPGLPALASAPTKLSFPSAHTATAVAGARMYARLGLPRGPLFGLAAATALSRLYLGMHYPTDVAAGAALGAAVSTIGAAVSPGARRDASPATRRAASTAAPGAGPPVAPGAAG